MKRPPGRPLGSTRVKEPGSTVSIWVPKSEHDHYAKIAAREEQSISKTIRLLLKLSRPS